MLESADESISVDQPDTSIAFSRYLGLPAAAAMGAAVSFAVLLFVLGGEIIPISRDQAPRVFTLATLFFLPLLLCLAERAGEVAGSAGLYQFSRSGSSARSAFAAGWLMLGGELRASRELVALMAELTGGSEDADLPMMTAPKRESWSRPAARESGWVGPEGRAASSSFWGG